MSAGYSILAAIVSGLLVTLSLPAYDFAALGWIALAPLLYALKRSNLAGGAVSGWLFGCAFGAGTFHWMSGFPDLGPVRFGLVLAIFGLFYLAFGLLYVQVNRRMGQWMVFAGPALWVATEFIRSNCGFLSCPWNLLAYSQHAFLPAIQAADITGAYGTSFALAMTGEFASRLPQWRAMPARELRGQSLWLACTLVALFGYGGYRLLETSPSQATLRVALVQPNIVARSRMSQTEQMLHLATYAGLTQQVDGQRPQLIVWPSSSLPAPLDYWAVRVYVQHVASRASAFVLAGGAGGDKFAPARAGHTPYSNSEFLVAPDGRIAGQYNKIRLTPFTEQVPLYGAVSWPRWLTTLDKSFVAGDAYTVFRVGDAAFGAPICWENTFPDLFRKFVLAGARFMVSVTNEHVFGNTAGPYQTFAMNVFRAVENRVAIARVATTGISAFIDDRGRVVQRVRGSDGKDLFVRGTLTWDMPLARERSFYTAHGDIFAFAMLLSALAFAAVSMRPGRPAAHRQGPPDGRVAVIT